MNRAVAFLIAAALLVGCGSVSPTPAPQPDAPVDDVIDSPPTPPPVTDLDGLAVGAKQADIELEFGAPSEDPEENPGEDDLVFYDTGAGEWSFTYRNGVLVEKTWAPIGVAK